MSVGMPAAIALIEVFGELLMQAFDGTGAWGSRYSAYHVGSSVMNKSGWRDVDVRWIMDDDEFTRRFGSAWTKRYENTGEYARVEWGQAWQVTCWAFSELGKRITGLPIDFQIQPVSYANEKFKMPECVRSALTGITSTVGGGG